MKLNKIMSIFLVVLFVLCFALTAFASEQPLFLPEPEGILTAPPTVIDGQNNAVISGGNYSSNGSGIMIGGPLDTATTGGGAFVPPVAQEASIAPEITKHPGSEEKKTGESTSFIARAYPYDTVAWMAIDPVSGEHVAVDSIGDKIKGVSFTGTHSEQLFINNLTDAINGWKFYAVFSNNFGRTITGEAEVTVPIEATPTPAPTPTPTPAPTPTPTPAPTPTAAMPASGNGTTGSPTGTVTSGGSSGTAPVMPTSGQRATGDTPEVSATPYTSLTGQQGSGIVNTSSGVTARSYTGAYILAAAAAAVIIGAILVMALYMKGKISLGKFEEVLGDAPSNNGGDGDEFYNPDDFKNT
ncbi:MAG: hypothetical protein J6S50_09530 [Oscillospiraceae bacterium]|nr:hypothetical protein [Oscillospiraceae bacterium]